MQYGDGVLAAGLSEASTSLHPLELHCSIYWLLDHSSLVSSRSECMSSQRLTTSLGAGRTIGASATQPQEAGAARQTVTTHTPGLPTAIICGLGGCLYGSLSVWASMSPGYHGRKAPLCFCLWTLSAANRVPDSVFIETGLSPRIAAALTWEVTRRALV
ncbi:hypothetical protein BU16DRAFT_328774 [Lophium mytilinum]|uniref:Uncharacterized protein n=1 Tax=Lophium mytilinum TaxID=390894 RepID=A0A6A6R068_9PEZI|nr:hypothetical protein BU16DRAFT_328774 [Lophium mytilinum]